ncbi:nucleotidyltransferase family protein [Candidatus Formimonas warabiya]|uniref:Nucleotidyltransferase family protein n=1 Tax=Formimonas warabiya TaxID=1761012 RepID=A0A3G1KU85_FORW1|nr:nucleotidyltransferase family protein [Candidatus Formimonas warabiya]ATW26028.1 hypothetical protein DCMF_15725 [Candidatus Formimonas warabiya]
MNEKLDREIAGRYLISLLAAVLHNEVPPPIPQNLDLLFLYKLASRHSVANMACYGLSRLDPLPDPDKMKAFQEARKKGLAKEARQELEVRQILSALEENYIKCMPLKGFIIKHFYPQPDMRLMADVDILVDHSQMKRARDTMLSLGYTVEHTGGHHDVYHKQPVMNIELHRTLIPERMDRLHTYFESIWNRVKLHAGTSYQYEMSQVDFYIYLMAHMAKHHRGGGTGIRSVMDVWVYRNYYKEQIDGNYVRAEFEKTGLSGFAQSMEGLSEQWFNKKIDQEIDQEVAAYILANGTYGSGKNAVINRFIRETKEAEGFTVAKLKFALRMLFPARPHMEILFPFLHKMPFLMPVCWAIRGMRTVIYRRSRIRQNLGLITYLTESRVEKMKKIQQ